jgi:F0F1-type ATP synthase assembly protein I
VSVSLSAAILLGFLAWLLWRYANVRLWHALICALFGFYLATASIGPHIANALRGVAHFLSQLHL